jgi:hypothetical protein
MFGLWAMNSIEFDERITEALDICDSISYSVDRLVGSNVQDLTSFISVFRNDLAVWVRSL